MRDSLRPVGPRKGPYFLLPDSSRARPRGQAGERVVGVWGTWSIALFGSWVPEETEGEVDTVVGVGLGTRSQVESGHNP